MTGRRTSLALAVLLVAATATGCGGRVLVRYGLPPGRVDAELDLQGATSTSTIDIPESETIWAVVDVQSQRDGGDLATYDTRPMWG